MGEEATYSFPILTNKDIVASLNQLDIHFTEQDLSKPSSDTLRPALESLVELLVGVTREEMQQIPDISETDDMGEWEYVELHVESLGNLSFFRALGRLMKAAGIMDFSLRDVFKPESQRVRRYLSAIINFAKFREEKLATYDSLIQNSDQAASQREDLEAENARLSAELTRLQQESEREKEQAEEKKQQAKNVQRKAGELDEEEQQVRRERDGLKEEADQAEDRVQSASKSVEKAQEEQRHLEANIVSNPDQLQRDLDRLAEREQEEQKKVEEAKRRTESSRAREEALGRAEKDVTRALNLMREVESEIAKESEAQSRSEKAKERIQEAEDSLWNLDSEVAHLQRQQSSVSDKLRRLSEQGLLGPLSSFFTCRLLLGSDLLEFTGGVREEAAESQLATAKEEYEAAQREKAAAEKEREKRLEEEAAALEEHRKTEERHVQEMDQLRQGEQSLFYQVKEYHSRLLDSLSTPPRIYSLQASLTAFPHGRGGVSE